MAVVCNPIRICRWSELMVVCVCHSDEVMREADSNETFGKLGRHSRGALWESLHLGWKSLLKPPGGCISYRLFRRARVNGEHWSPSTSESVHVSIWSSAG